MPAHQLRACSRRVPRPALLDEPGLQRPEGGGQSWLAEHCRCPSGVLDFEPTGSAAAFVPVAFPDLVRHGEGRLEAAECELAGPCDQLLAVCPVLVSATADAGGLTEDLQCTPGGRGFGCRRAVWCLSNAHAPDHVGCGAKVELLEAAACLPRELGCGDGTPATSHSRYEAR